MVMFSRINKAIVNGGAEELIEKWFDATTKFMLKVIPAYMEMAKKAYAIPLEILKGDNKARGDIVSAIAELLCVVDKHKKVFVEMANCIKSKSDLFDEECSIIIKASSKEFKEAQRMAEALAK